MAITLYSGPPGSGKSHALVAEVLVPAVLAGRRVLTNVDGVDPDKVHDYCAAKIEKDGGSADDLGEVIPFDGERATQPGFFPTERIADTHTVVKAGDLVIFDEWRLYWPRRGKLPSDDLEPFLRWHRHLVNEKGVATDVVIASQLATDIHQDFKGLIAKSYKFRKLDTVGLASHYVYRMYDGPSQAKGEQFINGREKYRKEIFPLYSSYSGAKGATELRTDRRGTIFSKSLFAMIAVGVALFIGGIWYVVSWFTAPAQAVEAANVPSPGQPNSPQVAVSASVPWRIVGQLVGDDGIRVVVVNEAGAMRVLTPENFSFDGDRPVSGTVDGQRAESEQFVKVDPGLREVGSVQP